MPTLDGRLRYAYSTKTNVFWSALVEKAYVKFLEISYERLKANNPVVAMKHLTGGTWNVINLKTSQLYISNMFENDKHMGLIAKHTYSITKIETVNGKEPNQLVRIQQTIDTAKVSTLTMSTVARRV